MSKSIHMNYNVIICAIGKDESDYLVEWIEHHLALGVELIVIYDDNSKIPIKTTVKKFINQGVVEVIECQIINCPQLKAYNHCLYNFHNKSKWIAFIDIDEFICLKQSSDIVTFVNMYEAYGGVCLSWKIFNANGHMRKPEGHVADNYLTHIPVDSEINRHVKTILQPKFTKSMINPHYADYIDSYYAVNENNAKVDGAFSKFTENKACINHYYTKSYDDWICKVNKGRPDRITSISNEADFWKFNKDLYAKKNQVDDAVLHPLASVKSALDHRFQPLSPLIEPNIRITRTLEFIAKSLKESIELVQEPGLFEGKIGVLIFLFHYSKFSKQNEYYEFAIQRLTSILAQCLTKEILSNKEIDKGFASGLTGIIWAVDYLNNCELVEADMESLLFYPNRILNRHLIDNLFDYSLKTGLIGYGVYYFYRLKNKKRTEVDYGNEHKAIKKIVFYLDCLIESFKKNELSSSVYFDVTNSSSILSFLVQVHGLEINEDLILNTLNHYAKLLSDVYRTRITQIGNPQCIHSAILIANSLIHAEILINNSYSSVAIPEIAAAINSLNFNEMNLSLQASAMTAHVYKNLYHSSHHSDFKNNAISLFQVIVDEIERMANKKEEFLAPDKCGFSNGLAGVGLAILDAISTDDEFRGGLQLFY